VVVSFLKAGLVHVPVGVLGSVVVGVGVLVLDVLVLVFGVRVRVSDTAMLVLVRMRPFMGVLFSHLRSSPLCETPCVVWLLRFGRLHVSYPSRAGVWVPLPDVCPSTTRSLSSAR
jgi:hypothetical protein